MIKRFAWTLIAIASLVYGGIFALSRYYETSFFDEILMQLNRLNAHAFSMKEVQQSKLLIRTIIENDHPPAAWPAMIVRGEKKDHRQLFYYYKVWTLKSKLTTADVKKSYPIFKASQEQFTILNIRFGRYKPVVQFPFFTDAGSNLVCGLFFPINEPPFSSDLNKDGQVDQEDVAIARKRF